MEVSEVLKQAWAAVRDAGLPESIQPVAFREAVRLLSPPTYLAEPRFQAAPSGKPGRANGGGGKINSSDGNGDHGELAVTEAEIYDRVVQQTGVDRDKLEQLVHRDGDAIKIGLPGIKLGKYNADKTRTVAQILTIVRGFGLEEDETSVEIVRSEVQRLKCYDSANFSSQLGKLNGFVITGTGANRRIRAKSPGIAAFPHLVDAVVGSSDERP
jgi:hypothetical protein